MTDAIADAASLILFGAPARPGAAPPLLMVERGTALAFAGGALVFPGGRVDPADRALALEYGDADAAPRIAAIRETIEETGIAPAITPEPTVATIAAWRAALASGAPLATVLAEAGCRLLLDRLVPFARWCPPAPLQKRIFDTRFYIAEAPTRSTPIADGGESVRALWLPAAAVLADAAAGRHRLVFPTRRNLERLAGQESFAAATAHALAHPNRTVTPHVETRDGEQWLCIADDLGYPITAETLATVTRG